MELFGSSVRMRVAAYFDCLRRTRLKGHFECPCGSKKRLRNCHRAELQELAKRIPWQIAQQAFDRLRSSVPSGKAAVNSVWVYTDAPPAAPGTFLPHTVYPRPSSPSPPIA